jgi:thiamine kinase-like enzyme
LKDEIQTIINRIPQLREAEDITIEQIGGLTNNNYRIIADNEIYVLRISGKNTTYLGIDRNFEYQALRAAEKAQIGPEVVHYVKPEGHLLTRWIEGEHWPHEEYRKLHNIQLIIKTVKQLHSIPLLPFEFNIFRRVESFIQTAESYEVVFSKNFDHFLETMNLVERDQRIDNSTWFRFCHNDLVSVNLLYSERIKEIKIIDFEFAGMGDIYFDLANLVYCHDSIGPIPEELEEYLLHCYFGKVTDNERIRLTGMKFMFVLFTALWGLAQYGLQKAGLIGNVEGFDYFDFAQYLFTHDVKKNQENYLSKQ